MKSSDRAILIGLVVVGCFAAFWFLALSPKRAEVSELDDKIDQLNTEIAAQEQLVASGTEAQEGYQENYSTLVTLGKAAPSNGDSPSLLTQLVSISDKAQANFGLLQLGTAPEEPAPVATETTADQTSEAPAETTTTTSATPVAPTEATAASLPIGATLGSAGLGRIAYDMRFQGDFFQIADLFEGMDNLISSNAEGTEVGGRLITVNGFKMTKPPVGPLDVELSITSFVLPESQGLTAGGTSTMPPESVPTATPVAETTP